MRRGGGPSNRRVPSYAILLLLSQLFQEYSQHGLPPITLSVIIGEILIYFRAIPVPWNPSIPDACLSAYKVLYYSDYSKILVSQLEHGDDWHLYYNMVSFMVKGKDLESRMGSSKYALLLGLFTVSTGITYVGLNYAIGEVLEDASYLHRCAVGFSGVIFALKVLTTHAMGHSQVSILGFPLGSGFSAKYSVWIELFLISLITPNASFVGHLAGILVGLAYVYGPLKPILNFVHGVLFGGILPFRLPSTSNRFTNTRQSTGYRQEGRTNQQQQPAQNIDSRFVPAGMSEEEQMRRALEESLQMRGHGLPSSGSRPSAPSEYGRIPTTEPSRAQTVPRTSLEEIRRKRLSRFT